MGDSTQLQQVVMNLMINAYHAVEASNGEITVSLEEVELTRDETAGLSIKPGRHARICVSDTGCGMDTATLEKIFDPYFTTKPKGKGTGLGLSLVYGIVKDHKGEIKVESAPGTGTTFCILLPANENVPEELQTRKMAPHPTGNERILLVDDEEIVAELIGHILERLGYQVTTRLSSVDALNTFRKSPEAFDLLVTDMTMPNMTGDELAKAVTEIRPDLPIILCTGFSEKIGKEEASRKGIKEILMKPISLSEISKKVRAVLGG